MNVDKIILCSRKTVRVTIGMISFGRLSAILEVYVYVGICCNIIYGDQLIIARYCNKSLVADVTMNGRSSLVSRCLLNVCTCSDYDDDDVM